LKVCKVKKQKVESKINDNFTERKILLPIIFFAKLLNFFSYYEINEIVLISIEIMYVFRYNLVNN